MLDSLGIVAFLDKNLQNKAIFIDSSPQNMALAFDGNNNLVQVPFATKARGTAVDRDGQILDFMLSDRRDMAALRRFFKKSIATNGIPERIITDTSGTNLAGQISQ